MDMSRRLQIATAGLGLVSIGHAAITWPMGAVLALFGGGAALAFVAEAAVVRLGWLVHNRGLQVLGVPLYTLVGWTSLTYLSLRVALSVLNGPAAVVLAAGLATLADAVIDPRGVAAGHWTYMIDLGGPAYRGVPWWNAAGWLVVSGLAATLAVVSL